MFSFLKKKKPQGAAPTGTSVPVEEIHQGSHGDHWGAMIGFEKMAKDETAMERIIEALAAKSEKSRVTGNYSSRTIKRDAFSFKAIDAGRQLITAFPIVHSVEYIPFTSKNIREWAHAGGVEAQIAGLGRNTFGLLFFATDYLEKKEKYFSTPFLEIALSGIALSAGKAGKMEGYADDFVGYIPNEKYKHFSIMSYVGRILSLAPVSDAELGIEGYSMVLQLIQHPEKYDFFQLSVFVNIANVQVPSLAVGDRIAGDIWLQGRMKN